MLKRDCCPNTEMFLTECLIYGVEWNRLKFHAGFSTKADSERKCREMAKFLVEATIETRSPKD